MYSTIENKDRSDGSLPRIFGSLSGFRRDLYVGLDLGFVVDDVSLMDLWILKAWQRFCVDDVSLIE